MIQVVNRPSGDPRLAINDAELGPRIRQTRILPPDEREAAIVLDAIKRKIQELGRLDPNQASRLEKAMDDSEELVSLVNAHFDEEERLRMGFWPEYGPDFRSIDEGAAIKEFVIREFRKDLQGFAISVVFQKGIPPVMRRGRLGTAAKLPGKMHFLTGFDALITLDFMHWRELTDRDRQRLVHHELMHLEVNRETGGLMARDHDFEDFAAVIQLYGLRSDSERFNTDGRIADMLEQVVTVGSQLDLIATT